MLTPVLWLLGFVPALIALYFLKLKRRDQVISSTILWRRTVEDLHVNAPFQRLRRSWLLILQLLVLLALILAVWRPRISGNLLGGRNLIVLVDVSASMSAHEAAGTRLDQAKAEARALVAGLSGGDRMALLEFASRTSLLEPLTTDKARLEGRIDAIQGTALPTNLEQALLVAASIAETLAQVEVLVLGDGCYGDLTALPPQAKRMPLKLIAKGTPLENAGITELDVRRSFDGKGKTEVFALVENTGAAARRVVASLEVEGRLVDARELEIQAGAAASTVFDVSSAGPGIATISLGGGDAFPLDDRAWARIDPPRTVDVVVVGKANPWIDLVLEASSGVHFHRATEEEYVKASTGPDPEAAAQKLKADVAIFDRADEKTLGPPVLPSLYFDCRPPLPRGLSSPEMQKVPVVVDWDRTHPVNRFLVFSDLYVEETRVFASAPGYRSLVDADTGSLLGVYAFHAPGRRSLPVVLVAFDILKTNWPLGHYSFPIFFANTLPWLASTAEGAGAARVRTGEALSYEPRREEPAAGSLEDVRFRSPSGSASTPSREGGGALVLPSADEAGVYEVVRRGETLARLPAALLSSSESKLRPSKAVDFGDFKVAVQSASEETAKDLWKYCVALALGFLAVEWYVYNRRLAA